MTIATAAGQPPGHIGLSRYLLGFGYLDELLWRGPDDVAAEPPPRALSIYASTPADSGAGRDELAGARLALADAGGAVDGRPVQLRAFPAPPSTARGGARPSRRRRRRSTRGRSATSASRTPRAPHAPWRSSTPRASRR